MVELGSRRWQIDVNLMHLLWNFRCLHSITEVICQNPELAVFFDMFDLLQPHGISSNQVTFDSSQSAAHSFEKCTSIGIQTDVHPIPYAKDTNHTWNVWDLRRMAIQLANLQKCTTKSTQTHCLSTFGTQTKWKPHFITSKTSNLRPKVWK